MKSILLKAVDFLKTYKKKIITVIVSGVLAIIIITGVIVGVVYYHAKSNIKYSQPQLQKIALGNVSGKVVDVEKKLNFREQSFQYEFKIRDKSNMLQEVRVDSKYGAIIKGHNKNHIMKKGHNKENRHRQK